MHRRSRKGGTWHRTSGRVFVCAMIALGLTATGISVYEGKLATGGALVVYFALTAYATVTPLPAIGRRVNIGLMALALGSAAMLYAFAFLALDMPGKQIDGAPAGMMFFLGTVLVLAAIGDLRMIAAGGIHVTRRLPRHLWRMCFSLFIASGSFFLGQMRFIPEPIRFVPLILVLAVGPLVLLVYWMWRVRLRQNLRGLMTTDPIAAKPLA